MNLELDPRVIIGVELANFRRSSALVICQVRKIRAEGPLKLVYVQLRIPTGAVLEISRNLFENVVRLSGTHDVSAIK